MLNEEEMDQNVVKGIERQLRKEPEPWENVRQEMYQTYKFAETATKIVQTSDFEDKQREVLYRKVLKAQKELFMG